MKHLLILLLLLIPLGMHVRASDDDDDDKKSDRDEVPDFSNIDEYIYQPKSNAVVGMRFISGVRTSFKGNGTISSPEAIPDPTAANISRTYHDGEVAPDARGMSVDNGNGTTGSVPITPDGKTNSWGYDSTSQVTTNDYLQMHIYSAVTDNTTTFDKTSKSSSGLELSSSRDMGNITRHLSWQLTTGMTLNDIQSSMATPVNSNLTTITDTYDLFGQVPLSAPYSAPSSANQNLVNTAGVVVVDSAGDPVTQQVDTTILLGNAPLNRTVLTVPDTTSVVDQFKLHGAYAMFRAGPALTYSFGDHLKLVISAGPALIYASTTYAVTELLTPLTGGQIEDQLEDTEYKILPAAYADVTLQYDINDRAGLYFGAFYQESGSYTQSVGGVGTTYGSTAYVAGTSVYSPASYSTHVDFSNQQGIRTGISIRF